MDDTISRQAAIDALNSTCDRVCHYSKKQRSVMCSSCPLGSAFDVLDELPTAEPEIIRCKDCKHGRPYKHTTEYVACEVDCEPIDRDSDFYCADGKRRE